MNPESLTCKAKAVNDLADGDWDIDQHFEDNMMDHTNWQIQTDFVDRKFEMKIFAIQSNQSLAEYDDSSTKAQLCSK